MSGYTKLSNLVGSDFTVKEVQGFTYKKWDDEIGKMLTSSSPSKGFRRTWKVVTDRGILDMGDSQVGQLTVGSMTPAGETKIIGETYSVKSNGKSGKDIRYFLNRVEVLHRAPDDHLEGEQEGYDDSVPF